MQYCSVGLSNRSDALSQHCVGKVGWKVGALAPTDGQWACPPATPEAQVFVP